MSKENKEAEIIIDEIKFFNVGNITNPAFGMVIKGRSAEDYHTPIEKILAGIDAEIIEGTRVSE